MVNDCQKLIGIDPDKCLLLQNAKNYITSQKTKRQNRIKKLKSNEQFVKKEVQNLNQTRIDYEAISEKSGPIKNQNHSTPNELQTDFQNRNENKVACSLKSNPCSKLTQGNPNFNIQLKQQEFIFKYIEIEKRPDDKEFYVYLEKILPSQNMKIVDVSRLSLFQEINSPKDQNSLFLLMFEKINN